MKNLLNRLIDLSQLCPDKQAVIFKKEQLTYLELCEKIAGMASLLREEGIAARDRVCFSAVSKPEMVVAYMAIQACGAIAVFIDKNGTPENIAAVYEDAGAKLLLTDKPMKEYAGRCRIRSLREMYRQADTWRQDIITDKDSALQEIRIEPAAEDVAELLFTTGTTGKPKGVILTYRSVFHILSNTIEGIGIDRDDCLLLPLPLNHSFALRVLRAVLYQGATVVLQNGFTFAKEVENNVTGFGCNALAAVPASYEVMKSQMQDAFVRVLGGMRFIEFSAGSLSIRQRKEITELLPKVRIHNTWGSSESGGGIFCVVSDVADDPVKIGSLGRTLPQVQVKIIDAEGNTIKSDAAHPGRMALKGDMQMAGYWNRPELTAQTLVDGWLLTGDMAYIDEDNYIYMLGRADDIINVGGEKISPIEVEETAGQYDSVRECACIGVEDPDGILGQIPVLFLTTKNTYTEEGLIKFLSDKLERYKIPKRFIVTDAIPRNRMQKIDRKELLSMWENRDRLYLMNPIMQTILTRRSIRKFTDREVPAEILDMICRAGIYAPSGHNLQTWRFTVIESRDRIMELKEVTRKAALSKKVYFYGFESPRCLILVSNDRRNPDGIQDASCAAQNIMLAAHSYGIGSVWLNPLMRLCDEPEIREVLNSYGIPGEHIVWAMIALGYPVESGSVLAKKMDVVNYVE